MSLGIILLVSWGVFGDRIITLVAIWSPIHTRRTVSCGRSLFQCLSKYPGGRVAENRRTCVGRGVHICHTSIFHPGIICLLPGDLLLRSLPAVPLLSLFWPFYSLYFTQIKYIYSYIRSGRIYAQLRRLGNCQKYWYL